MSVRRHVQKNAPNDAETRKENSAMVTKPFRCSVIGEIKHTLAVLRRYTHNPDIVHVQLIEQLVSESDTLSNITKNVYQALKMLRDDTKLPNTCIKATNSLQRYLRAHIKRKFVKATLTTRKKALVLECPLFNKRAFQYGPACAIANRDRKRFLVYYPVGSGKTLAALHGARTFLEIHPHGHIIVITTLANVKTTWNEGRKLYLKHVPDKHNKIKHAFIQNIDRWFSNANTQVAHYNRLIQLLLRDPTNTLKYLIQLTQRQLKAAVQSFRGPECTQTDKTRRKLIKEWRKFKKVAQKSRSMLEAAMPEGPYFLIVDECQDYINLSAKSMLIRNLAQNAQNTLLLSATPINDSETQKTGLYKLLGTPRGHDIAKSVLWTNNTSEKPQLITEQPQHVHMSNIEWATHKAAANSMSTDMHSNNAYLVKSRQSCNCNSKFERMLTRITQDISERKSKRSPIRIVIYSFFIKHGSKGFAHFLKKYTHGRTFQKIIDTTISGHKTQISTMHDSALKWFNRVDDTCKILILTGRSGTGISLKNVNVIHLMEPQWSLADEQQAIGRCTRKGSHDFEKTVKVVRWLALPPHGFVGRTADQKVAKRMLQKHDKNKVFLQNIAQQGHFFMNKLLQNYKL